MLTGKGLTYGGSLARKEATGYGLVYFMEEMLKANGTSFDGKTVVVSGSGNVAIYATEKATAAGRQGSRAERFQRLCVRSRRHRSWPLVKEIKEVKRGRIKEYAEQRPNAEISPRASGIWSIPCDVALPCATQNELNEDDAKMLVKNGCYRGRRGRQYALDP